MPDIISARAPTPAPAPLLCATLRHHLVAGHTATLRRIQALAERSTDPAAKARLSAQADRIRADIAELEAL